MSRWHSYINSARQILDQYSCGEPFAAHLKKFFAAHKKYGSADRRYIGQLCYSWFRCAAILKEYTGGEPLAAALFLCSHTAQPLVEALHPEWLLNAGQSPAEKMRVLGLEKNTGSLFPFSSPLSSMDDPDAFVLSHLQQPGFFIRIRPGYREAVWQKLSGAGISFSEISETCLSVSAGQSLDAVLAINREVVIQDLGSQRVGELLQPMKEKRKGAALTVWDCCAASGGKSILARDILGQIKLTVTDIRESILVNLRKRFREAAMPSYRSFTADLSQQLPAGMENSQVLVMADVPCSGSGTWGRTPEQLLCFREEQLMAYQTLQRAILRNAVKAIQPGGFLLYSTCSVFRAENEEQVRFIQEELQLERMESRLLTGYTQKADTLFAALFYKP